MSLTNSKYNPQVGDYVVWEREYWGGTMVDEGWVYFKGDPVEPNRGFITPSRYISIETNVKDKYFNLINETGLSKEEKVNYKRFI